MNYESLQKLKKEIEERLKVKELEVLKSTKAWFTYNIEQAEKIIQDLVDVKKELLKYTLDEDSIDLRNHEIIYKLAELIKLNKTIKNVKTGSWYSISSVTKSTKNCEIERIQEKIDKMKKIRNEYNEKSISSEKIEKIAQKYS